jgi:hypothetical protein
LLTGQEFPYYKGYKIAALVQRYGHGTARSSFVPYEAARFGNQANAPPELEDLGSRDLVLHSPCHAANRAGSFKAPESKTLNRFSQSTNVRAVFQFGFLLGARSVYPSQIYPIWVEP